MNVKFSWSAANLTCPTIRVGGHVHWRNFICLGSCETCNCMVEQQQQQQEEYEQQQEEEEQEQERQQ